MKLERQRMKGFTRTELVSILVILIVLVGLFGLFERAARSRGTYIMCRERLNSVYGAVWDSGKLSHAGLLQWDFEPPIPATMFRGLSNLVSPNIFVCPTDRVRHATNFSAIGNSNLSYFLTLSPFEGAPTAWILAGDRHLSSQGSRILNTSSNALEMRWHTKLGLHPARDRMEKGLNVPYGNILFADGHVEMLDDAGLAKALRNSNGGTNLLAIP